MHAACLMLPCRQLEPCLVVGPRLAAVGMLQQPLLMQSANHAQRGTIRCGRQAARVAVGEHAQAAVAGAASCLCSLQQSRCAMSAHGLQNMHGYESRRCSSMSQTLDACVVLPLAAPSRQMLHIKQALRTILGCRDELVLQRTGQSRSAPCLPPHRPSASARRPPPLPQSRSLRWPPAWQPPALPET